MSQLQLLTTGDIWCPDEGSVEPGKWVKHIKDSNSLGLVVGRAGELNTEVLILWSVQPKTGFRSGSFTNPCGEIAL